MTLWSDSNIDLDILKCFYSTFFIDALFGFISQETWTFLITCYGGGPVFMEETIHMSEED